MSSQREQQLPFRVVFVLNYFKGSKSIWNLFCILFTIWNSCILHNLPYSQILLKLYILVSKQWNLQSCSEIGAIAHCLALSNDGIWSTKQWCYAVLKCLKQIFFALFCYENLYCMEYGECSFFNWIMLIAVNT